MSPSGMRWREDVPVAGQKVIEADPQIVDAFKNIGYSLPAAVADLVDNSVDADASMVLIRFLHTEDDLVSLVVVDDGRGWGTRASTVQCSLAVAVSTARPTSACTGWA